MDIATFYFGVLPWFWKRCGEVLVYAGFNAENEILHTLAFLAGFMFSLQDMIEEIILAIVIGPPIVAAIITIVQKGGPYLAIYLWGFMLIVSLIMMTVYPVLIAPLFNKFTPLPEGELRTKIENLVSSLKFPLKKLFVVDGSARSSHSNASNAFLLTLLASPLLSAHEDSAVNIFLQAYMYGFFKNKRFVLYDTLIQCNNEEKVVAVIAHELGRWKLNHTVYNFFIVVQHMVIPLFHVVILSLNLLSRAFEFQADAFAKKLGYAIPLQAGLIKLQTSTLTLGILLTTIRIHPWSND
ncbi:hypothetical protein SASPL_102512 [Salvia splendens]|uniref:CAAX prenyl protease n=1 Tax=Salvia splendens TaxID=180675 RepID=A0A8X9ADE7_SALSN|nr:hypothetical protein SASPL_102512 [Salvia splendens]